MNEAIDKGHREGHNRRNYPTLTNHYCDEAGNLKAFNIYRWDKGRTISFL